MKAYIAAPFFNEEQLERVKFIEDTLKENNVDFFSPRLDTYVKPNSDNTERTKAFEDNLKAIQTCTFMIAVTDGKDVGTMFECGFAYAMRTPILYFAETLGDKPFNLMLAQSATIGTLKSRNELKQVLRDPLYIATPNFDGEIE